jgi:Zinc finger, C3HC4 type (RING finger)
VLALMRATPHSTLVLNALLRLQGAPATAGAEAMRLYRVRDQVWSTDARKAACEAVSEAPPVACKPGLLQSTSGPHLPPPSSLPPPELLDKACVVCLDRTADRVLMPCGHAGYCGECARELARREPHRCPVCRASIDLAVYVAADTPVGGCRTVTGVRQL